MNKWLELLMGLILIVIPIGLILPGGVLESWGLATLTFIKGGVTCLVILIGLILLILGISDLKE